VQWEYRVVPFRNSEVIQMQNVLDDFGRAGWELVTMTTTVRVYAVGNELVAVFKRPTDELPDLAHEPKVEFPPGWM
jgi:hypothetical protein